MQVNSEPITIETATAVHDHRFTFLADAKLFALAGNATITLESQVTGVHYTYKIREAKEGNVHFVNLLTGPNNEADFTYLGIIRPGQHVLTITKASKLTTGSGPVLAFNYFWSLRGDSFPSQLVVRHEGRCGRCGRTLTVPSSIDLGIGPDCAELMGLDL